MTTTITAGPGADDLTAAIRREHEAASTVTPHDTARRDETIKLPYVNLIPRSVISGDSIKRDETQIVGPRQHFRFRHERSTSPETNLTAPAGVTKQTSSGQPVESGFVTREKITRDDVFGGMLSIVRPGHPVHRNDLTKAEWDAVTLQRRKEWQHFNKWERKWVPTTWTRFVAMCERCRSLFKTRSRCGRWCSDECYRAGVVERHPKQARPSIVCECGRGIVAPAATGRLPRYCSPACRQRAYRQRKADARGDRDAPPATAPAGNSCGPASPARDALADEVTA